MPLEKQVCSLELAKRLKELGVKQESQFDWVDIDENDFLLMGRKHKEFAEISDEAKEACVSAFTVAELGEILPYSALGAYFNEFKGKDDWSMAYGLEKTITVHSEADARAKMLIYLLENNLVTL